MEEELDSVDSFERLNKKKKKVTFKILMIKLQRPVIQEKQK